MILQQQAEFQNYEQEQHQGAGGGGSSGSTAYARKGTSNHAESYGYGPALSGIINDNLNATSAANAPAKSFLTGLVDYDPSVPGFQGAKAGSNLNPFTPQYEQQTSDLFNNRLDLQMARSQSGPEAVLAPLQRGKSFREAETLNEFSRGRNQEIRQERNVDSGIMLKSIENLIGQRLQAAHEFPALKTSDQSAFQTAATLLGPKNNNVNEDFVGTGDQASTGYSYGANLCCFIFLEAFNGKLPWFVRFCRDLYITPKRRKGYNLMASWLVPAMRHSNIGRSIVNTIMVKPITKFGGWLVREEGFQYRTQDMLITKFWFFVWDLIGGLCGK